jgi:hypothetical protein
MPSGPATAAFLCKGPGCLQFLILREACFAWAASSTYSLYSRQHYELCGVSFGGLDMSGARAFRLCTQPPNTCADGSYGPTFPSTALA